MQKSAERLAFDFYLRSGRRLSPGAFRRADAPLEAKSNPYHDPRTGRFTSKDGVSAPSQGDGSWRGGGYSGGGGGSFGGGGATSHDAWPATKPERGSASGRAPVAVVSGKQPNAGTLTSLSAGSSVSKTITKNGYIYELDAADRTTSVTGALRFGPAPRSRTAQALAGGEDRLNTDDGGHYVAARFNGPNDTFNHFAQDANFNRGGYRVLEDGWAKNIKAGKQVYVSITPSYAGLSKRPSSINVVFSVDGQRGFRLFSNNSKGKSNGK